MFILPVWIDVAGKLGPVSVAVAVFIATRRQTAWSNAVSARAAAVEDQKLRLALLDRRLAAIKAIEDAQSIDWVEPGREQSVIEKFYSALRVAEVVFAEEDGKDITECLHLIDLRSHILIKELKGEAITPTDREEISSLNVLIDALVLELPEKLFAATKVGLIPPLNRSRGWRAIFD